MQQKSARLVGVIYGNRALGFEVLGFRVPIEFLKTILPLRASEGVELRVRGQGAGYDFTLPRSLNSLGFLGQLLFVHSSLCYSYTLKP